jgi:hypothetical protein
MGFQALVALTVVYLGHYLTRPYCVNQTLVVFASLQNFMAGRDQ